MATVTEQTPAVRSACDASGRLIPISDEERKRRSAAAIEALNSLDDIGDEDEQRETLEAVLKGIAESRSQANGSA